MNCRKALSYLSVYSDGLLPNDTVKELEDHVRDCKWCAREKFLSQEIQVAAKALPQTKLPEDFNLKLFSRIYAEQHRPTESYLPLREPSVWRRPIGWATSVVAVAACALFAVFLLGRGGHDTLPISEPVMHASSGQSTSLFTVRPYREPATAYENVLGVSGERSSYRATSFANARTLRVVDDSFVESLYVELSRRMGLPQPSGFTRYASHRDLQSFGPRQQRVVSRMPVLQTASGQ